MAKKKKKNILKIRFYQIYFALTALALVAIAIGTVVLINNLRDYESAQPVYVAAQVAAMFEEADYDNLYAIDTSAQSIAEGDRDFYVNSMRELTEGRTVQWTETFSDSEDTRKYAVTLDGSRFATFTLIPSGLTTRGGNALWTLQSVTTHVELKEAEEPKPEEQPTGIVCHITAPTGYAVNVSGVILDMNNARTALKPLFESDFLPSTVVAPTMTEYTYTTDNESPEVTVTTRLGASVPVTRGEGYSWFCSLAEDEALKARYGNTAISLGKKIARFMSQEGGKDGILRICVKNSPAQKRFENLGNTYATPHTGYSIRNESASQFYRIAENCFTCHVSFDFVLNTTNGEMVYPTTYTFCVTSDKGGGLYNLLMY